MAARSIAMAIPQVPINMRSNRPDYEFKEYPKMMSFRNDNGELETYKDDTGRAIKVRDEAEEADFRLEHPEAIKSFNTNPTAVRNEQLEDENAKLRALLEQAGVKLDKERDEDDKGHDEDDKSNALSGVVQNNLATAGGGGLPSTMTTGAKTATPSPVPGKNKKK